MSLLLLLFGRLRGPLRALGAAIPGWASALLAAGLCAGAGWHWHAGRVRAAFTAGSQAQAEIDRTAYRTAAAAAAAAQHAKAVALAAHQSMLSKEATDALADHDAALARRYDDLRLRWAASRAAPRPPGDGRATALPGSAASTDDAACAARGWVAFDAAAAAAHAADTAIARDDAWIDWAAAQVAAWPAKSKNTSPG